MTDDNLTSPDVSTPELGPSKRDGWDAALALVVLMLCIMGLNWTLPDYRVPEFDSLVIDGRLAYEGKDLSAHNLYIYPPLVFQQMELLFTPLRWIIGEDSGLSAVTVSSIFILAGRAVSALLTVLTAWLVYDAARRLMGRKWARVACLLYILTPVTLYYGHTTNAEASYVFWLSLGAWCLLRWELGERRRIGWLLGTAVAGGLSVAAKDQAGFLLVGPGLWALWRAPKQALPASLLAAAALIVPYLPRGLDHLQVHLRATTGVASDFYEYGMGPLDLILLTLDFGGDILRTCGVSAALALAGFWVCRKRPEWRRPMAFIGLAMAGYLLSILFLAHRSYPRFAMPFLPLLALPGAYVLRQILGTGMRRWLQVSALGLQALWAIGLIVFLSVSGRDRSKAYLRDHLRQGDSVALFTVDRRLVTQTAPDGSTQELLRETNHRWHRFGWLSDEMVVASLHRGQAADLPALQPTAVVDVYLNPWVSDQPLPPDGYPGYVRAGHFGNPLQPFYAFVYWHSDVVVHLRADRAAEMGIAP